MGSATPYDVLGEFPDLHRGVGTGPLNGLSMRDHLRAIKYRDLRASLDTGALATYLKAHPDRIRAWQDYCEDKRTDGGFYLDSVGCEVGRHEMGKGRFDRASYSSPHDTCAAYIVKELDFWMAWDEATATPTTLKLMADYDCHPLWRVEEPMGDVDPTSLPIPRQLVASLHEWAATYDKTLDRANPIRSGFQDAESARAFDADGRRLWRELQQLLGPGYRILYFSALDQHLHE